MRIILVVISALVFILSFIWICEANSKWNLDLESGLVFNGYNNVRIPNQTGTLFSLSNDLDFNIDYFARIRLTYLFKDRHSLSVLVAPLSLYASGRVSRELKFNEILFPANVPLKARYRFDSYRLSYRYDIYRRNNTKLGFGFTAKVRSASISLENNEIMTEKKNIGFVPLLNFRMIWQIAKKASLLFEGDALAAPQGRAEDILLALQYHIHKKLGVKFGYRLLEGGVNVEEVYNFTLLNYIVIGLTLTF